MPSDDATGAGPVRAGPAISRSTGNVGRIRRSGFGRRVQIEEIGHEKRIETHPAELFRGIHNGLGDGILVDLDNPDNSGAGVRVQHGGSGDGVQSTKTGGGGAAIKGRATSVGTPAGDFDVQNPGSTAPAIKLGSDSLGSLIEGTHTGGGALVSMTQIGNGPIGWLTCNTGSDGLNVENAGTGDALATKGDVRVNDRNTGLPDARLGRLTWAKETLAVGFDHTLPSATIDGATGSAELCGDLVVKGDAALGDDPNDQTNIFGFLLAQEGVFTTSLTTSGPADFFESTPGIPTLSCAQVDASTPAARISNLSFLTSATAGVFEGNVEVHPNFGGSGGNLGLGVSSPANPIDHASGANLSPAGVFTNASSRVLKENFAPVDPRDVLEKLRELPITRWNYKVEGPRVTHLGPTAEDFRQTFGLGQTDAAIGTIDADGVALAAIQGLHTLVQEKDREILALEARIAKLESLVQQIVSERLEERP